jgi:hypothetical protein
LVEGALRDAARGSATGAARQRSGPPPPAAQAPAQVQKPAVQEPAAEKRAANDSAAAMAKAAPQAADEAAKKKAETPAGEVAQLEGGRLREEKKSSESYSARSLQRKKPDEQQVAPAPPPEPAPPAAAAPASPPVAAMGSRDDAERDMAVEDHSSAKDEALAGNAQARQSMSTAKNEWPFGLAPGLDAAQACRSLTRVLGTSCRYVDGVAVVEPPRPVVIDRGELMDRKATRVTLFAPGGRLTKVALQVEGFTTEQILVAPPAP